MVGQVEREGLPAEDADYLRVHGAAFAVSLARLCGTGRTDKRKSLSWDEIHGCNPVVKVHDLLGRYARELAALGWWGVVAPWG